MGEKSPSRVMTIADVRGQEIKDLLGRVGLSLVVQPPDTAIRGSFWGDSEAGLVGATLYARDDTPLHSVLHEACHWMCMDPDRRDGLDTNAGGDYDEENAVCCLQILLADEIPGFGAARCMADMDTWGYTFRLGSARAWFEGDAEDARAWLQRHGLIVGSRPTWRIRGERAGAGGAA